jgi:hypothetical protein
MTSKHPPKPKQPHALTVRAWPLEVSGQGLGIIGVLAVVALVLLFFKPDITAAIAHIRAKPAAVTAKP